MAQGLDAFIDDPTAEAELLCACTGVEMGMEQMEAVAARIVTLERCLDVRLHDRNRAEDEQVILHLQWPEKTDGTHLSPEADEFRAALARYYRLRGWDEETGRPEAEALGALGLH
jgi:aldehyde:ferredoxin oxidoreductase